MSSHIQPYYRAVTLHYCCSITVDVSVNAETWFTNKSCLPFSTTAWLLISRVTLNDTSTNHLKIMCDFCHKEVPIFNSRSAILESFLLLPIDSGSRFLLTDLVVIFWFVFSSLWKKLYCLYWALFLQELLSVWRFRKTSHLLQVATLKMVKQGLLPIRCASFSKCCLSRSFHSVLWYLEFGYSVIGNCTFQMLQKCW